MPRHAAVAVPLKQHSIDCVHAVHWVLLHETAEQCGAMVVSRNSCTCCCAAGCGWQTCQWQLTPSSERVLYFSSERVQPLETPGGGNAVIPEPAQDQNLLGLQLKAMKRVRTLSGEHIFAYRACLSSADWPVMPVCCQRLSLKPGSVCLHVSSAASSSRATSIQALAILKLAVGLPSPISSKNCCLAQSATWTSISTSVTKF